MLPGVPLAIQSPTTCIVYCVVKSVISVNKKFAVVFKFVEILHCSVRERGRERDEGLFILIKVMMY